MLALVPKVLSRTGGSDVASAKEQFLAATNWHLRRKGHGAKADLAEGTGFLRSYVSRALTGSRTPAVDFMEKTANYYRARM